MLFLSSRKEKKTPYVWNENSKDYEEKKNHRTLIRHFYEFVRLAFIRENYYIIIKVNWIVRDKKLFTKY